MIREENLRDFAAWQMFSGDIDPVYPVLKTIGRDICDTDDERVSLTLLYVAFYNLSSALTVWLRGWRPGKELNPAEMKLPTGTERRAHRDPKQFTPHLAGLGLIHAKLGTWDALRTADWPTLQQRLTSFPGNGRWAAYKTGEMLADLHGWPAEPTDAGHANSSGPRKGLIDIYPDLAMLPKGNDRAVIAVLDHRTADLGEALVLPVKNVETVLCDWHSMLSGRYYVGHDLDVMLEQAHRHGVPAQVADLIGDARRRVFHPKWLGECNDWDGVRKPLNVLYRDEQKVRWWD